MSDEDDYAEAKERIESSHSHRAATLDLRNLGDLDRLPPEIDQLSNVRHIYLTGNQVTDITPLQGLVGLQTLDLSFTKIADIVPLSGLFNLRSLNLLATQTAKIEPLQKLYNLQFLKLFDSQVSDIAPLQGLRALRHLDLALTHVEKLAPLQNLPTLQYLFLRDTLITDIAPLQGLTALQTLDLRNTRISDLRPIANHLFKATDDRMFDGLIFSGSSAARSTPELTELARIGDEKERTQKTLAYLRSLPPWPEPLPWDVPEISLEDRAPDPPAPDEVPRILWTGAEIDVDHTPLSDADMADPIKQRMFDRLQETVDELKRIGNRYPEVAGPARRLSDACEEGYEAADLLDIHIEVASLTDIVTSNVTRPEAERISDDDLDLVRRTTRLGPPLTLGNPDVDLFEQRNADYAEMRRPATVPHSERLVADALVADAPMTDRAKAAAYRAAQAPDTGRTASYRTSLVKNTLLQGVGFVAAGYLGHIGVEGATWSLEFLVVHKDAIMTVAASWGEQGAVWAADLIARSQEILKTIRNRQPKS